MYDIEFVVIPCECGTVEDNVVCYYNDVGIVVRFPLYHECGNIFGRIYNLLRNRFNFTFCSLISNKYYELIKYLWTISLPDIPLEYTLERWGKHAVLWMDTPLELRPDLSLGAIVEYLVYGKIYHDFEMFISGDGIISPNSNDIILKKGEQTYASSS